MPGFFGFFDYTKPGPGVPKDAPEKARIVVFFEIYTRKFWNLVKMNILFSIFNIPAIIVMLLASMFVMPNANMEDPMSDLLIRFALGSIVMCIPVITVGPAQAGFTYILRNYAREEHAFLWWDFKENAIKNFKEGVIISLVDLVAFVVMVISMRFYLLNSSGNLLMSVAGAMLVLFFIIFLMMHMYIYPMLVTFKLGVKQIYKNAFVFAVVKFLPNLGILLLCAVLVLASFYNTLIGIILYPLITISTIGLITNFYIYPKLKKYMMDKLEEEEEGADGEGGGSDEEGSVFEDGGSADNRESGKLEKTVSKFDKN